MAGCTPTPYSGTAGSALGAAIGRLHLFCWREEEEEEEEKQEKSM